MEAGLTDHGWSVEHIAALLPSKPPVDHPDRPHINGGHHDVIGGMQQALGERTESEGVALKGMGKSHEGNRGEPDDDLCGPWHGRDHSAEAGRLTELSSSWAR